jgi:glutamyl/glutaminyl-tRNA synthetase
MEIKFSKQDFIQSKKYKKYQDVLNALLDENKMYTVKDVEKILNNFLKKGVR